MACVPCVSFAHHPIRRLNILFIRIKMRIPEWMLTLQHFPSHCWTKFVSCNVFKDDFLLMSLVPRSRSQNPCEVLSKTIFLTNQQEHVGIGFYIRVMLKIRSLLNRVIRVHSNTIESILNQRWCLNVCEWCRFIQRYLKCDHVPLEHKFLKSPLKQFHFKYYSILKSCQ